MLTRAGFSLHALAAFAVATITAAQGPPPEASAVLAAARMALGGEAKIAAVKSFIVTGRTQQLRGNNLVPIEFEMSCELPDRYVRRDEIPAQESGPTTVGFNGEELILLPAPATPPADAARRARVATAKQDFARSILGMFAGSFSSYPLTFTYAGQAEAPQGRADVLDVKAAANPAMRLFVHRDTHLPGMVSWQTQAQGTPVENRIYFADYRDVDGLRLPFRLRRAVGAETVEETTVDRFRINPKIDPRKFDVRR
jgi:hypothetical protein